MIVGDPTLACIVHQLAVSIVLCCYTHKVAGITTQHRSRDDLGRKRKQKIDIILDILIALA